MIGYLALVSAAFGAAPAAAEDITFNKHVAPILWKNCAGCHRPGEIGPFALLTYKDAAKRADFLRDITSSKRMPPWKAAPGSGEFVDARVLTDAEIATVAKWADGGAKEGDPKDLPPAPKFQDGWQLGEPDLLLKMAQPYALKAAGRDVYRNFVLPISLPEDRTVAAVEFRPGNRKIVHHALFYLDNSGNARKRDDGTGFSAFGAGFRPTGGLGGWAPGAMPRFLPDGMGKYLKKGSDLVLQIHYHPTGKAEQDQSMVGIYFTKKPVTHFLAGLPLVYHRINIPAGEKAYEIKSELTLPIDVQAVGITPHMHLLGKKMSVTAVAPGGTRTPLIAINDWDFNWQDQYLYTKPVKLPKGTKLELTAVYDNSSDNPRNPNTPPRHVRWGEQTTDEMCLCTVQVTADNPAELRRLAPWANSPIGLALGAGVPVDDPKVTGTPATPLPPKGEPVPIPEKYKELLAKYDTDGDGKLSEKEIEAMPLLLRLRVRKAIEDMRAGK